jgi:hypothetical protein
MISAIGYAGCFAGNSVSSSPINNVAKENADFDKKVDSELAIHLADEKVQYLKSTLGKLQDLTPSQKDLLNIKLLNAESELRNLRNNYRNS